MKKFNLTIIAAITALFALGIIFFQADSTEASNNLASPSATPKKRVTINKNANVKVNRPKRINGGIESVDNWDARRKRKPRKPKN